MASCTFGEVVVMLDVLEQSPHRGAAVLYVSDSGVGP
jgi:hypothetical protein